MDRFTERRFIRLEGKINSIARAVSWILAFVIGFGVYFLAAEDEWAPFYGVGAAIISVGVFTWDIRQLEKRLPDDESAN